MLWKNSAFGIRVNSADFRYIFTEMTKKLPWSKKKKAILAHGYLDRWGELEDLVGVCIFLSSDDSSYTAGQDIYMSMRDG